MADGESRDRGLTTGSFTFSETEISCPTTFDDEGRGASIPDSMEITGERLVERRREDAGTSLSTTIHRGLAEFQVGDLLGFAFFVASWGRVGFTCVQKFVQLIVGFNYKPTNL
ncbi:hypothetical protein BRARA_H00827 [Brassica rapa]|uniref:Uncharacterized protein n=1 Tax=Brassica campestris TaxID=3711 RepID=A0A397YE05_BRACM|nr:hypothetical protein BRARA_H00827 [Brassica rapa]